LGEAIFMSFSRQPHDSGAGRAGTETSIDASEAAVDMLNDTLVWDNHGCMPLRPGDHGFLSQLDRYRRSGVDVVAVNIGFGTLPLEQHLRQLADFRAWVMSASKYRLVRSTRDIDLARERGELGVLFDVEGMAILDAGDHGLIAMLRELGVGWMLIAYNEANAVGGGCRSEDHGLSDYGRKLLREMKRVGMMVCCSHTGHRTAREAIEAADNPVIFSHSNAAAVHAHYRNIPDDLIEAVAAGGGVVGVNGVGDFLGPGQDYVQLMAAHIDHMVSLVGPEHVGIGLDYVFDQQELVDYVNSMPETFGETPDYDALLRFAPPEVLPALVTELQARGYPDQALRAILGGNWRRVAEQVWCD